jgi:hypothetical protein
MSEALQSSRLMLSLYSPTYFTRLYCGKEWEVFRRREALYGATRPPGTYGVILPLLWVPARYFENAPPATQAVQFNHASLGAIYEEKDYDFCDSAGHPIPLTLISNLRLPMR